MQAKTGKSKRANTSKLKRTNTGKIADRVACGIWQAYGWYYGKCCGQNASKFADRVADKYEWKLMKLRVNIRAKTAENVDNFGAKTAQKQGKKGRKRL